MIEIKGPQSEEARNDEANGVETDPILAKIAKSRGINLQKLLKTLKNHPGALTDQEQVEIIEYSSAVLPKALERKMIEMHRNNRDHLNELLFNHNARAATRMATVYNNRYARTALNRRYVKEDFLSAARYGLWQGARRFDLDRMYKGEPIKFITFATPWMFRYISEMLYEKENMIIHHSLDAKAFDDSNLTLGDVLTNESEEEATSGEDATYDAERPVMNRCPGSDDEENLAFEDNQTTETLMQSLEKDLNVITGPLEDEDVAQAHQNKQVDACMKRLKMLSNVKVAKKHLTELKMADPSLDTEVAWNAIRSDTTNESVIAFVDRFCNELLRVTEPVERAITLFVGRKIIQSLVKQADPTKLSPAILNVHSMLKDVPASKKRLLTNLGLDRTDFDKLCKHYAYKYMNRGA